MGWIRRRLLLALIGRRSVIANVGLGEGEIRTGQRPLVAGIRRFGRCRITLTELFEEV